MRSTFAIISARPPAARISSRAMYMSDAFFGNETAMKSASKAVAVRMSSMSLEVSAGADKPPPCRLMPLRSDSSPPTTTVQSIVVASTRSTRITMRPSLSSSVSPAWTSSTSSL